MAKGLAGGVSAPIPLFLFFYCWWCVLCVFPVLCFFVCFFVFCFVSFGSGPCCTSWQYFRVLSRLLPLRGWRSGGTRCSTLGASAAPRWVSLPLWSLFPSFLSSFVCLFCVWVCFLCLVFVFFAMSVCIKSYVFDVRVKPTR